MGDWYYVGHYGQLGPLTREQVDELIEGGVIARDTYVWRTGMAEWQIADTVAELRVSFQKATTFNAPPPPPMQGMGPPPGGQASSAPSPPRGSDPYGANPYAANPYASTSFSRYPNTTLAVRSDRSRVVGGVLQIIIPGAGRMYLGYFAYGVLQLVLTFCSFGVLYLWSFIDGLIILAGGLKFDGFGRVLGD